MSSVKVRRGNNTYKLQTVYVFRFVSESGINWALTYNYARQSSNQIELRASAPKAVDGNADGIFGHNSCSKTIRDTSYISVWWRVQLYRLIQVDGVVITNRADCCGEL